MTQKELKKLDDFIESLGLGYEVEFIPKRFSRNAKSKEPSLNWRITLSRGSRSMSFTYSQGIGFATPKWQSLSAYEKKLYEKYAPENQYYNSYEEGVKLNIKLIPPNIRDVLYSLVVDADVINFVSFKKYARDLGLNEDSISEKKLFEEMLDEAVEFIELIGRDNFDKLVELYENY